MSHEDSVNHMTINDVGQDHSFFFASLESSFSEAGRQPHTVFQDYYFPKTKQGVPSTSVPERITKSVNVRQWIKHDNR